MNIKLVTDVTTEPITLAEVKSHLRLDSSTFAGDITTYQSIVPGSHVVAAAYSLIGTAIDVLGKMALMNLSAGTNGAGGTVDVKIQESDDNSTYTDWAGGAFTQVTTANDNAIQEKQYTGSKQYVRVVATVANASCEFGVDVIVDAGEIIEDDLIGTLITVAREYCEKVTRRALATKTVELILDDFPGADYIELPYAPLQTVSSVKYKNSAGTETTMVLNTDYIVLSDVTPGIIALPYGKTWASFVPYPYGAVRIQYVAGYTGTTPNIIPKSIKQAILLLIGHLYAHREATTEKALQEAPFAVNSLLWQYRVFSF